jgi:D-alanine-D-alanine ligase
MEKQKVTILYDAVEDQHQEEAKSRGEKLTPLVCEEIERVLAKRGHSVSRLAAVSDPIAFINQLAKDRGEVIFNVCESLDGVNQQEQNVAAVLELIRRPYTGTPAIGLSLAQDKALTKKILQFHGIRTPKFMVMHAGALEHADSLSFPLIVKPSNEDASIGIDAGAVVHDLKELMERISFVQTEFGAPALVEEFIDGRELYVGVLEGERPEPLPILEWDFSRLPKGTPRIASSEAKWENDNPVYRNAPEIFPDDLPDEVVKAIGDTAVEAFKLLKLRDYGRIDMRLRRLNEDSRKQKKKPKRKANNGNGGHESELQDWEFHVIEVNPNPHLASNGELSLAARQKGMTYPDLIEGILGRALARLAR